MCLFQNLLLHIHQIAKGQSLSLLSVLSKVFECYMYGIITNHLQTFHPLAESQWGFTPEKSTVTGLLATMHNWLSILKGGGEIGAVFFDLRKAFDSILHEVLLKKLQKIGLSNPILAWISDYLTCREQKVVLNGTESQHTTVWSGVPHILTIWHDCPCWMVVRLCSMQMTCYYFAQFRARKTIVTCRWTS